MKKPKISIEDANLFAALMRESGLDKEADRNNPNWKMDLLGMVKDKKEEKNENKRRRSQNNP